MEGIKLTLPKRLRSGYSELQLSQLRSEMSERREEKEQSQPFLLHSAQRSLKYFDTLTPQDDDVSSSLSSSFAAAAVGGGSSVVAQPNSIAALFFVLFQKASLLRLCFFFVTFLLLPSLTLFFSLSSLQIAKGRIVDSFRVR